MVTQADQLSFTWELTLEKEAEISAVCVCVCANDLAGVVTFLLFLMLYLFFVVDDSYHCAFHRLTSPFDYPHFQTTLKKQKSKCRFSKCTRPLNQHTRLPFIRSTDLLFCKRTLNAKWLQTRATFSHKHVLHKQKEDNWRRFKPKLWAQIRTKSNVAAKWWLSFVWICCVRHTKMHIFLNKKVDN